MIYREEKLKANSIEPKNILVVEDEPGIARVCLRVLNSEGFEVEIEANGKTAWETLGQKEYDLYIIDIRTPGMNGIELYRNMLKGFPELADRVLFTTGDTMSSNIKDFLEHTRRPYLAKPFTPDDLRNAVNAIFKND